MGLLYLGVVVVSTLCMGLVDHRWRLALFDRPRATLTVVAAGTILFLVWDLVAIESRMYVRGDSPAMTGVELLPELPVEELFFIVFLSYLTCVLHGGLLRVLGRDQVGR